MGFSFSSLNPLEGPGPYDPAGVLSGTGLAGGEYGDIGSLIADPLDLFGHRAERTQEEVSDLLLGSTKAGIAQQEEQLSKIEQLQEPFRQTALREALPDLEALAMGGELSYQPSRLFQAQSELGQRGLRRKLAAQGKLDSSQRFEEEAGLLQGLAAEDVDRFERARLAQLKIGEGSAQALSSAGTALGGNIAAMQSALGQNLATTAQAAGAQRQASLQSGAQALSGLGQYLAAG